jgi:hypothetical protein
LKLKDNHNVLHNTKMSVEEKTTQNKPVVGVHARQLSNNSLPGQLQKTKYDDDDDDDFDYDNEGGELQLKNSKNHNEGSDEEWGSDIDDDKVIQKRSNSAQDCTDSTLDDEDWDDDSNEGEKKPTHVKQSSLSDSELQTNEDEDILIVRKKPTKPRKTLSANTTPSPLGTLAKKAVSLTNQQNNHILRKTSQLFGVTALRKDTHHRKLPSSLTDQDLPQTIFRQKNKYRIEFIIYKT